MALIDRFSSKTALLRDTTKMARAKRHYIPGYVWHTPVKQSKKRFDGVNNAPMP
jgi:hypothetical protein